MKFIADIEFTTSPDDESVHDLFDRFREATLPGTDWGLTMSGLREGGPGLYEIDIETADGLVEDAQDRLHRFREATTPSREYGIVISNLRPEAAVHLKL